MMMTKNLAFLKKTNGQVSAFFLPKCLASTAVATSVSSGKLSNQEVLFHRAKIFDEEKKRQASEITRVEKIKVRIVEPGFDANNSTLIMNKGLSTPFNCAMHLNEMLTKRSVLAQVDGKFAWDMHRPLENDCQLKFLHFKDEKPFDVNSAYWRSCSFILGYLMETSFKENHFVEICSFPPPNILGGSFAYDVKLNMPNWKPTRDELRCLSISAYKLCRQELNFERLQVKREVAEEMFKYNE